MLTTCNGNPPPRAYNVAGGKNFCPPATFCRSTCNVSLRSRRRKSSAAITFRPRADETPLADERPPQAGRCHSIVFPGRWQAAWKRKGRCPPASAFLFPLHFHEGLLQFERLHIQRDGRPKMFHKKSSMLCILERTLRRIHT